MRLLLLIAWLFIEIWLIATVADRFGVLTVVAILIGAAIAGGSMIQRQGFRVMFNAQAAMQRGELPTRALTEGSLGVIAGLLLLVPGLLSDILALPLLLPPLRRWLAARAETAMLRRNPDLRPPVIIEGEYRATTSTRVEILPPHRDD